MTVCQITQDLCIDKHPCTGPFLWPQVGLIGDSSTLPRPAEIRSLPSWKHVSRIFPVIGSFPRFLVFLLIFRRGKFMPHAVFLDRFFINRTRRPRFRGYFRYMGNFLEKSKPRLIDDRGKLPHTRNILETKNLVEDNCLLREISSTKKRRSRIFPYRSLFPRSPSVRASFNVDTLAL